MMYYTHNLLFVDLKASWGAPHLAGQSCTVDRTHALLLRVVYGGEGDTWRQEIER